MRERTDDPLIEASEESADDVGVERGTPRADRREGSAVPVLDVPIVSWAFPETTNGVREGEVKGVGNGDVRGTESTAGHTEEASDAATVSPKMEEMKMSV